MNYKQWRPLDQACYKTQNAVNVQETRRAVTTTAIATPQTHEN